MEGLARRQSHDHELAQRAPHTLDRVFTRFPPRDELGEQWIIEQCDVVARFDAGIPPNAGATRHSEVLEHARRRQEVIERILGGDAAFDRVSAWMQLTTGS